jgi:hypothetical protein
MNRLRGSTGRHDVVMVPIVWVAVILSILLHLAALWLGPSRTRLLATEAPERGRTGALAVQLAPRASPAPSAVVVNAPPVLASRVAPRPAVRAARARPARPRQAVPQDPAQSLIARADSEARSLAPEVPITPAPPPPAAAAMPPAPAEDLAAYVAARRRARGDMATPPVPAGTDATGESDLERRNRIVAANLGLDRVPTFGRDPRNAGGIFEIKELNYDDAQFYFFGFDKDIGRNARQLIDVRRVDDSDIRVAVVRKMISIIRENVPGDFLWVSQRLGREVSLSARPGDNAELEAFIMRDIFPGARPP